MPSATNTTAGYVARNNHCECDGTLVREARAIREDEGAPPKMRRQAAMLITAFALPVCKVFPQGVLPPRPRRRGDLGLPPSAAVSAGSTG